MTKEVLDPRRTLMISYYKDPKSETFGNRRQSMLKAGYSKQYSENGKASKSWLSPMVLQDVAMIQKAEKNLKKYLDINVDTSEGKNIDLARLQVDVSKFITKNLAQGKYSDKVDDTVPNIQVNIVNYNDTNTKTVKPMQNSVVVDVEPVDTEKAT